MAKTAPEPLQFRSQVGMIPTFFVARTGDTPPTASITPIAGAYDATPLGDPAPVEVTETPDTEFGARWALTLPEPFWAEGVYRITVSTGEVYDVTVGAHAEKLNPSGRRVLKLSPDELRRLGELDPAEMADVIKAFTPTEEA